VTRKWCTGCLRSRPLAEFAVPSGEADRCRSCRAEPGRRWREMNPEAVAAYNAERREAYREAHPLPARACVVCDAVFEGRPDALVCGAGCRAVRNGELRRRRRLVA
jgi:hypothetical protein